MHSYARLQPHHLLPEPIEPIQPDFLWQPCSEVALLPEAQLLFAVIQVNWQDANGPKFRTKRTIARRWFFTEQFAEFCGHLGLNLPLIRDSLYNRWRRK